MSLLNQSYIVQLIRYIIYCFMFTWTQRIWREIHVAILQCYICLDKVQIFMKLFCYDVCRD